MQKSSTCGTSQSLKAAGRPQRSVKSRPMLMRARLCWCRTLRYLTGKNVNKEAGLVELSADVLEDRMDEPLCGVE